MIKIYIRKIFWRFLKKETKLEKELGEKIENGIILEKGVIKKVRKKKSLYLLITSLVFVLLVIGGYLCLDEFILEKESNLKFGFVTDLEYGYKNKIGNKLPKEALGELEKAVNYFNNEFHPEIVVEGGDMVESSLSKKNTTIEQFGKINEIFSKLTARRGYIFGNHDLRDLTKEELRNVLGMDANHSYFDIGDWRFVLMDTNFENDGTDLGPDYYVNGRVSEEEFNWLKEALNTERPTILFSHHSSLPDEVDGVFYANTKNLSNGLELHNFLKQYRNLVLFISGHEPGYRFQNTDSINYLVVGNLVTVNAAENFASLEAKYNKYTKKARVTIEKHGEHEQVFEIEKKIGEFNWKKDLWKR